MRRPNHASRFEGIAKTKLQASRAPDTETLQSQVNKAAEKRLSLSGLEILHGQLHKSARSIRRAQRPLFPHSGVANPVAPQPSGLKTRKVEGGLFASFDGGRIGRETKLPPQLGHRPASLCSAHSRQNVHSKEQIIASSADGGKSLSQHSQLGRNSSISPSPI
jgi:hypothetical protein